MKNWAEKEVPSLELCKKLKDLGYPQNGDGWYWVKIRGEWKLILRYRSEYELLKGGMVLETDGSVGGIGLEAEGLIRAPTCPEMDGFLPCYVWFNRNENLKNRYEAHDSSHQHSERASSLPDSYAKMLVWLRENGYVIF